MASSWPQQKPSGKQWHGYWKWNIDDFPIKRMVLFKFSMLDYQTVHIFCINFINQIDYWIPYVKLGDMVMLWNPRCCWWMCEYVSCTISALKKRHLIVMECLHISWDFTVSPQIQTSCIFSMVSQPNFNVFDGFSFNAGSCRMGQVNPMVPNKLRSHSSYHICLYMFVLYKVFWI